MRETIPVAESAEVRRKGDINYDFLAGNNYPDLPPFAGGMKFTTQISLLLNFINSQERFMRLSLPMADPNRLHIEC